MMVLYGLAAFLLFLFSYTQVDLSLTLSEASLFQTVQKAFQYIGFYQRPLATLLFIFLVLTFFVLYFMALRAKNLPIWKIIIPMVVILLFSYPAFSYDIFNYMFYAKTILIYHKNPYDVIPLQLTGVEPWLSFMHWTHVPSPYTPLWMILSVPAYLLGFGYFLPTLWAFKAIAAAGYLGVVWFVGKILQKKDPRHAVLGMTIVALNPLVIFESLVSAHNDIVMMAFAMMGVYALLGGQKIKAFFLTAMATATKLMTLFLFPVMIFGYRPMFFLAAMIVGLVFVIFQREILPVFRMVSPLYCPSSA